MARPLKIDGTSGLQEMSDADLDGICYYLRVAYANQINGNGDGRIYVGTGDTSIGSATDTSRTQETNSNTRNYSAGDGTDYPSYPGTGTETDASYNYRQDRTVPSFPASGTLSSSGFMMIDGSNGIQSVSTEAQIAAEILTQTVTDMRTGDEVGTYQIATSSPGTGWVDKGVWYQNTTYSAGTTTYRLYLKTSGTAPSSIILPVMADGTSGVIEAASFNENHAMIQDVLLPALSRRVSSGDLNYSVDTSTSGVTRGTFVDTRQNSVSNTQWFTNPTYFSRSTPTGTATTFQTYYLRLS